MTSFGSVFVESALAHPEKPMIRGSSDVASYGDVARRVHAVSEQLKQCGVERGDVVACYMENQVGSIILNLANAMMGVATCPLSHVFSTEYFQAGIVDRVRPSAIVAEPRFADTFAKAGVPVLAPGPSAPAPAMSFATADLGLDIRVVLDTLQSMAARSTPDDLLMIAPTSGSTGVPKLVRRRHAGFLRYARFVGHELDDGSSHNMLLCASLNHVFGMHMLTTAMRLGACVSIPSEIDTSADLVEVRELDPTIIPMVPRVQRSFARQHQRVFEGHGSVFGPSAKFVCSAGGPANVEVLRQLQSQGLMIIEFYGSTEASVVAVTPRGQWRPGWAGKLAGDVEVWTDERRELWVRSPGVSPGYLDSIELNRETFDLDGYYRTGDLAEISDGWLRITGRAKDVFNTAEGSNIYPRRIEQKLEQLPRVEQAMLVGDGRPYMSAVLVLSGLSEDLGDSELGHVSPSNEPKLYREIGQENPRNQHRAGED